jgi:hypothetical protein
VIAAVADRTDKFGSADSNVIARKPLQVSPGLPRFLTKGDELDARLVIQDNTGTGGKAWVRLDVENAQLLSPNETHVQLPPGGQAVATFKLKAHHTGNVSFIGRTRLGKENDGFQMHIPALAATDEQSTKVFDGSVAVKTDFEFELPAHADPETAQLVVEMAPSGLASLGAAVDALIDYPHGCLEQTTSRLIPMTLLSDVLNGHPAFAKASHDERMEGAVVHLLRNQNSDGGFSLWEGGESEPFLTAYALWGLSIAQAHGYAVPDHVFQRGLSYVQERAFPSKPSESFSGIGEDAFVSFALTALKSPHKRLETSLFENKAKLPIGGLALLAIGPTTKPRVDLLNSLYGRTTKSAKGGKLLEETNLNNYYWYHGEDVRATAGLVAALVQQQRLNDAAPLVTGMLAERMPDGSWGSTFSNQWALFGLASYYKAILKGKDTSVDLWMQGERRTAIESTSKQPFARALLTPQASGKTQVSLRGKAGAELGAVARVTYHPKAELQQPVSHGMQVTRTLVDPDSGLPLSTFKIGQLVRVTLTLKTGPTRRQVALVDRLPAGFEPVDTTLATAQLLTRASDNNWAWQHREMHDERVAFFAHYLSAGTHSVSYLARVSRPGKFVHPAPSAEAMYDPDVYGVGKLEQLIVNP